MLIKITKRHSLWPTTILDFLLHSFLDFNSKVLGIPGAYYLHHPAADIAGWSGGITRLANTLYGYPHVPKLLLIDNKVIVITGKPVKLVYQNNIKRFSPGCPDHLLELRSLICPGALAGINKLFNYLPSLTLSVIATSLQLERDREVSFRLLLGRYPGIHTAP
ncbi:hypothetical protein ES702_02396 [subsurface metagenome]